MKDEPIPAKYKVNMNIPEEKIIELIKTALREFHPRTENIVRTWEPDARTTEYSWFVKSDDGTVNSTIHFRNRFESSEKKVLISQTITFYNVRGYGWEYFARVSEIMEILQQEIDVTELPSRW